MPPVVESHCTFKQATPVMHRYHNHVAFYTCRVLHNGDPILRAGEVYMPDGTQPMPSTLVHCGTCHKVLRWDKEDLEFK